MQYALSTTAKEVYAPQSQDAVVRFSAGNYATSAATVYIRKPGTKVAWLILEKTGMSSVQVVVPHGTQLEAYTDTGTADLAVLKLCCSSQNVV